MKLKKYLGDIIDFLLRDVGLVKSPVGHQHRRRKDIEAGPRRFKNQTGCLGGFTSGIESTRVGAEHLARVGAVQGIDLMSRKMNYFYCLNGRVLKPLKSQFKMVFLALK